MRLRFAQRVVEEWPEYDAKAFVQMLSWEKRIIIRIGDKVYYPFRASLDPVDGETTMSPRVVWDPPSARFEVPKLIQRWVWDFYMNLDAHQWQGGDPALED